MKPKIDDSKRSRRGRCASDDVRSHTVSTRLNEKELAILDNYRSQNRMHRGEYLRCSMLDIRPIIPPSINIDDRRLLVNIANNLNQIAKASNLGETDLLTIEYINEILGVLRNISCSLLTERTGENDNES